MTRLTSAVLLGIVSCAIGCEAIPPPHVMAELDAVAGSPSGVDAKKYAPSSFAAAEKLRNEAHQALDHDRQAHAQILAEQALAAYEEASAVARIAKAERRFEEADMQRQASEKELAGLKAEVDRAQADVSGLETQLKVVKDAAPIVASGPASPEREAARKEAARSMLVQAKFLCLAAELFVPKEASAPFDDVKKDLGSANGDLTKLETALGGTGAAPIDLASRTRATCLSIFQRARRADPLKKEVGSSGAEADALLGELSAFASKSEKGLSPERDERGIVVSVRPVFEGEKVSATARAHFDDLARVAAAHPEFRVAVVLHADAAQAKGDDARWASRASDVAAAFSNVPKERLVTFVAGNFWPVVDPHGQDKAKNARVEIVFIPPTP